MLLLTCSFSSILSCGLSPTVYSGPRTEALAPPTLGPHQSFTCFTSHIYLTQKNIYVCLECIDVCVCVCACMHPERPEEVGRCLPYRSPFIPLRQGLSMNLGACIFSARLGASKPQQSFCFYHPLEMGSQGCLTYYAGAGVWNLVLMIAEPVLTATESSLYLCTLLTPIMLL